MKLLLLFIAISAAVHGISQTKSDENSNTGKIRIQAEFHELRSTHRDFFTGESISVYKTLGKHCEIGAGIEHSYTPYHDDNGWKLYKLRFVPLYADVKYKFLNGKIISPFIYASLGWSFINYDEQPDSTAKTLRVSEQGIYAFGGVGADVAVTQHIGLLIKVGVKNFHLSDYDLEVNPHGVAGTIGMSYTL